MKSTSILFLIIIISSLHSCKEDECEDVNCFNGGTCNDGSCDCPAGYYGSDCSEDTPPIGYEVLNATLSEFPASNFDDEPWDEGSGPDLYLRITTGIEDSVIFETSVRENAIPGQNYSWSIGNNTLIERVPGRWYTFEILDKDSEDSSVDEVLGGYLLQFSVLQDPDEITLSNPLVLEGGSVEMSIYTRPVW